MAETDSGATDASEDDDIEQCRALTEDGERCSRPAQENGLCHQHDESDPTIDDEDADAESGSDGDSEAEATDGGSGSGSASNGDSASDSNSDGDADWEVGLIEVQNTVRGNASDLIGHEFDGLIGIERHDGGWRAVVEMVERSSIPDTEDILGRYEIDLGDQAQFQAYRRTDRYRRADTDTEEF